VVRSFEGLGGDVRWIELPPQQTVDSSGQAVSRPLGRAVHITRRRDAPLRVLLAIHVDTVYGPDDPFQQTTRVDGNTLRGPGVTDAKGGLAVMLVALEALERSAFADKIGWDVFINPDEEIGSPGSAPFLTALASEHALGLLFEPALPDGSLVGARKGSGTFSAVFGGRAAHSGRDPQAGRNAVHAMAEFVVALNAVSAGSPGITVNVGRVEGGGPVNVVPDRAACYFNVRVASADEQQKVERHLERLRDDYNARDGLRLTLSGKFTSPPKPLDGPTRRLLEQLASCGCELGLDIGWSDTGGVCDGNRLAAAGLPNVDSLGPRGGGLHSPQEFLLLDSLTERAKLAALLLMKLASGEFPWPPTPNRGTR
jgi:glutamate carboxypeptidase